jgi:Protein of unknown function (DUF3005)
VQSAEGNPTQAQQNEMAAKSPAQTPAIGAASPDANTQAREFGSMKHAMSAEAVAAKEPAPLPAIDLDLESSSAQPTGDPVVRANARIVSVDNACMAASDDTVDTDAKGLEARREASPWHDNVVYSNATLENSVLLCPEGLVDLDTRPGGTMPLIATRPGWRIERRGIVDITDRNGVRGEQVFSLERVGNRQSNGDE